MTVKRTDRIGQFTARDDAGKSYRVIVFQRATSMPVSISGGRERTAR